MRAPLAVVAQRISAASILSVGGWSVSLPQAVGAWSARPLLGRLSRVQVGSRPSSKYRGTTTWVRAQQLPSKSDVLPLDTARSAAAAASIDACNCCAPTKRDESTLSITACHRSPTAVIARRPSRSISTVQCWRCERCVRVAVSGFRERMKRIATKHGLCHRRWSVARGRSRRCCAR